MNAMSLAQWILAAAIVAAAIVVAVQLSRLVSRDGYGAPRPDPTRDWGTSTLPSHPYARRF
jgi:hypothetical protein